VGILVGEKLDACPTSTMAALGANQEVLGVQVGGFSDGQS
jgi:hypothetical protein